MSDNNDKRFEAQQQLAKKRLLKANNVQRRRLEKMVDKYESRARSELHTVNQQHHEIVRQAVVRDAVGADDLEVLEQIQQRVLSLKEQIKYTQSLAEPVRKRLSAKGLSTKIQESYRGPLDPLRYYTDPEIPGPVDEDVCKEETIGHPGLKTLKIRQCRSNPLWAEYERQCLDSKLDLDTLQNDAETLRAQVWALVTTDEILAALDAFKEKYLG